MKENKMADGNGMGYESAEPRKSGMIRASQIEAGRLHVPRGSEIEGGMDRLDHDIEQLDQAVNMLLDQIGVILLPEEPKMDVGVVMDSTEPTKSELATRLTVFSGRVNRIRRTLNDHRDRIDL